MAIVPPGNLYHGPRERGAALAIALVFLLLMTIIAMTAVSTSTLEEKMSANQKDQHVGFQAAESALREGEQLVYSFLERPPITATDNSNPSTEVWAYTAPGDFFDPLFDWNSKGVEYGTLDATGNDLTEPAKDPRYVVEERATRTDDENMPTGYTAPPSRFYYRITAHGTGTTNRAQSMTQSNFVHRYN